MTRIILKTTSHADRKDALIDRLRELGIKKLGQPEEASAQRASFSMGQSGIMKGVFAAAVAFDPEKEKRAAEQRVRTYDENYGVEDRMNFAMPELTRDGTVYTTSVITPLSPLEVVTNFISPLLPTFADMNEAGDVTIYESLDLAASLLGTRYVMDKLSPHVDEYNNDKL